MASSIHIGSNHGKRADEVRTNRKLATNPDAPLASGSNLPLPHR